MPSEMIIEALINPMTHPKTSDGVANEVEQRIKMITDAFPAAVAYVDQEGVYQFINSAYEKWIELPRDQILGRRPIDVLDGKTYEVARPHIERALSGEGGIFELRFTSRSGLTRDLCVHYNPGRTGSNEVQGYVVVVRDMTKEKRVTAILENKERLLLENKKRFESVANATGLGVWYSDLPNSEAYCSPKMREQYWMGHDDPLTLEHFLVRIHPDDHELVRKSLTLSIEHRQPYDVTHRIVNPAHSGEYRWIHAMGWTDTDDQGRAIRFDGMTIDVTVQKEMEDAIILSENRFRAVADAAPVPIWSANQTMHYDWFNKAWLNVTGRTLAEELLVDWRQNIHPEDYAHSSHIYKEAFRQTKEFELEVRLLNKDGTYRWFLNHGTPRYSPDHQFLGYIGTCIDIHDRRNSELTLREAVRSRDEFLSIVSHELKTPLTSIRLRNQMLQRDMSRELECHSAMGEKLKKLFDQTERSVDRLSRLVDDMLDISRITTGQLTLQKEKFDLVKMAYELADRMSHVVLQAKCRFQIHAKEPVKGVWDRLRIEQVLINLLTNAVKYGAGQPVQMSIFAEDAWVEVRVRDHGRGIALMDHERIFQRFERAIPAREISGLGLGLYIVRHILTMHGGSIHVESEPGQGAEFIMRLPRALEEDPTPALPA